MGTYKSMLFSVEGFLRLAAPKQKEPNIFRFPAEIEDRFPQTAIC